MSLFIEIFSASFQQSSESMQSAAARQEAPRIARKRSELLYLCVFGHPVHNSIKDFGLGRKDSSDDG